MKMMTILLLLYTYNKSYSHKKRIVFWMRWFLLIIFYFWFLGVWKFVLFKINIIWNIYICMYTYNVCYLSTEPVDLSLYHLLRSGKTRIPRVCGAPVLMVELVYFHDRSCRPGSWVRKPWGFNQHERERESESELRAGFALAVTLTYGVVLAPASRPWFFSLTLFTIFLLLYMCV